MRGVRHTDFISPDRKTPLNCRLLMFWALDLIYIVLKPTFSSHITIILTISFMMCSYADPRTVSIESSLNRPMPFNLVVRKGHLPTRVFWRVLNIALWVETQHLTSTVPSKQVKTRRPMKRSPSWQSSTQLFPGQTRQSTLRSPTG